MKTLKFVLAIAGLVALMGAILAPNATADWNKKTVVTCNTPAEIPDVHLAGWNVLPASTCVFKVTDSLSDRHTVQIFSDDEKAIYSTILAIPNSRLKATNKSMITFTERPASPPEALRARFYPGRTSGSPKAKAKATNTSALFTALDIPVEVAEPVNSVNEPVPAEIKKTALMAMKPTGEKILLAEVVFAPPAETRVAARQPAPAAVKTQSPGPAGQSVVAELSANSEPVTASGNIRTSCVGCRDAVALGRDKHSLEGG